MKQGKVRDTILKRSVINLINYKNSMVVQGAGVGRDCSVIDVGDRYILTSTEVSAENDIIGPEHAVIKAANNIAACGGTPVSASVAFVLPCKYVEKRLKELTRRVQSGCVKCGIQLAGGHTELSEGVEHDIVSVTVTGVCEKASYKSLSDVKPGMDIVVSKWIGLEGTVSLLNNRSEELLKRLPENYVSLAADFKDWLTIMTEAAVAGKHGVKAMHDISDGGIFAALWDLSECAGCGIEIDLKAIPIKQETVEFCEIFDINPYMMKSSGSLIMVTDDGRGLLEALNEAGISATIIGKTMDNNDKKIINGSEIRYLDKP